MGVKIVRGVAGAFQAVPSAAKQVSQSRDGTAVGTRVAQALATGGDAAVSLVRGGGRSEAAERLSLEKAEKVAKELKHQIREDSETALAAAGKDFSFAAVRNAFGV